MFSKPFLHRCARVVAISATAGLVAALGLTAATPAGAATVADLYAATVASDGMSNDALKRAFGEALDVVAGKLTGQRRTAGIGSGGMLGDPAALVRQYQPVSGGSIRVEFDPAAVRRQLDQANLPVWGDDRPLTRIDLTLPLAPGASPSTGGTDPGSVGGSTTGLTIADATAAAADTLRATAARRGVPVVVMTKSAGADEAIVERIEDLAGAVSRPAGAGEAVLTGRPVASAGTQGFHWTLVLDDVQAEWRGDLAEGVHGLADRLAERFAVTASAAQTVRLLIRDLDDFAEFGRVQAQLRSLDVVERADLERVDDRGMHFVVLVRGDRERLRAGLASRPGFQDAGPDVVATGTPVPDLVFRATDGL